MKIQSENYSLLAGSDLLNPRYVVALSFDDADTDITYLTSHNDCLVPVGTATIDRIDGAITSISGQSQRVSPDKAQHTIGNITFKLLDVGRELSDKINAKLINGEGLRNKRIAFYKGFEELTSFDDYYQRFVYLVDGVSYKDGFYTISCSDIQRTSKTTIFEPHQGVLSLSITSSEALIPVVISDPINRFPVIHHDELYDAHFNASVGYIKIDDEVICHSGWSDANYNFLTVVERGALNTNAAAHANPTGTSNSDQNKKIEEYIYIQMITPKLVYALLTGVIDGQGALPNHWHLGIDTNYVDLDSFKAIGDDLWDITDNTGRVSRFVGIGSEDGKAFIEKELLLWLGAFMPVLNSGLYSLKRLSTVSPYSPFVARLDESQIISYGALKYEQKLLINNIAIKWNWIDSLNRFTKTTQLIDADSISKHGKADLKNYQFKGVFTGMHSDTDLNNYFKQVEDRYASPPLSLQISVQPYWDILEVGDLIRISCSPIHDYNNNQALDRVFEVQQIKTDWKTGKVALDLFGGIGASSFNYGGGGSLQDLFYTSTGTDLSTVLTIVGGAVTTSGNLIGGTYYYSGDLTINDGVVITYNDNTFINIKGALIINGSLIGSGNGHVGGASDSGGTVGAVGQVGDSIGLIGLPDAIFLFWVAAYPVQHRRTPSINTQLSSLNIKNYDGSNVIGLPTDLIGSSGSGGAPLYFNTGTVAIAAQGGAGGASGAGLRIISRGGAFGVSGSITSNGDDGTAGVPVTSQSVTGYSGSGVGGSAGAVCWYIDGAGSLPLSSKITTLSGHTITQNVDYLITNRKGIIRNGRSVAAHPVYKSENQSENNIYIGYIPNALNGYVWMPAQESQEVTGYENKPQDWSKIIDDGNKPDDNANYIGATSQLSDDANLGGTANWVSVSGAGKPADNADVTDYAAAAATAQSSADAAEAAAISTAAIAAQAKADAAVVTANAYADGEVTNAEASAIATANAYADTTEAAAIAAAALDATTKANLAATTADWSGVSGAGTPADNADVTSSNTAAAISGQGSLATLSQVGTPQIVNQAVTIPYTSYSSAQQTVTPNSWITLRSMGITGSGSPSFIFASATAYGAVYRYDSGGSSYHYNKLKFRIYDASTGATLYETDHADAMKGSASNIGVYFDVYTLSTSAALSGYHALYFQVYSSTSTAYGNIPIKNGLAKQKTLLYLETKK